MAKANGRRSGECYGGERGNGLGVSCGAHVANPGIPSAGVTTRAFMPSSLVFTCESSPWTYEVASQTGMKMTCSSFCLALATHNTRAKFEASLSSTLLSCSFPIPSSVLFRTQHFRGCLVHGRCRKSQGDWYSNSGPTSCDSQSNIPCQTRSQRTNRTGPIRSTMYIILPSSLTPTDIVSSSKPKPRNGRRASVLIDCMILFGTKVCLLLISFTPGLNVSGFKDERLRLLEVENQRLSQTVYSTLEDLNSLRSSQSSRVRSYVSAFPLV